MKIVVSDTSPIINLAMIGRLSLLPAVFNRVIIPQKVFEEIVSQGTDLPGALEITTANWVDVLTCKDFQKVQALEDEIDPGESEAIILALEMDVDLILLDDYAARAVADRLGLEYTGLLGVLIRAKQMGFVENVRAIMDDLITIANFRVSQSVYDAVVKIAGE
ncbi:MAG: DUF3368 domain-containing protein [Saprospiraceae bacterium]